MHYILIFKIKWSFKSWLKIKDDNGATINGNGVKRQPSRQTQGPGVIQHQQIQPVVKNQEPPQTSRSTMAPNDIYNNGSAVNSETDERKNKKVIQEPVNYRNIAEGIKLKQGLFFIWRNNFSFNFN